MIHRIKSVKPLDDLIILVVFRNGVEVKYDITQLYDKFPQFKKLEVNNLFEKVSVDVGGYGLVWNDELDLDAEDVWQYGVRTGGQYDIDINFSLAEKLIEARNSVGMTQKQLSEAASMYQADISKIENGTANPSVQTLKRIAEGMNMTVKIEFVPKKNK